MKSLTITLFIGACLWAISAWAAPKIFPCSTCGYIDTVPDAPTKETIKAVLVAAATEVKDSMINAVISKRDSIRSIHIELTQQAQKVLAPKKKRYFASTWIKRSAAGFTRGNGSLCGMDSSMCTTP